MMPAMIAGPSDRRGDRKAFAGSRAKNARDAKRPTLTPQRHPLGHRQGLWRSPRTSAPDTCRRLSGARPKFPPALMASATLLSSLISSVPPPVPLSASPDKRTRPFRPGPRTAHPWAVAAKAPPRSSPASRAPNRPPVPLPLWHPLPRTGWDFGAARWDARLILILSHQARPPLSEFGVANSPDSSTITAGKGGCQRSMAVKDKHDPQNPPDVFDKEVVRLFRS
jgi:hypothetical protein